MSKIGFLFPGQGAQTVGMGRDFYDREVEARSIFDQADRALGFPLTKLCFEGPDEELTRTVHAQTAIFVTSLAAVAAIRADAPHLRPHVACGLSLGEFTALVALESITYEDGLRLVKRRAELMEAACQKRAGAMASIIGLPKEEIERVCDETGAELANVNSREQLVISGSIEAVEKACSLATGKGAKRAIRLKVGGAFHSSLMSEARTGLEPALMQTQVMEPNGSFIPNVTGTPVSNPEEIRSLLAKQVTSPVQWLKTMETVAYMGATELLEIGPGRVLKGLAKKIDPDLTVHNIGTHAELKHWTHRHGKEDR